MNETWRALVREAGLAAEHLAIGVSALGKANYAEHAYYGQAFFALSIGLERSAKLALVVDHALEHGGQFPSHNLLRGYGHNLKELLEKADQIASRRGLTSTDRLPTSAIHKAIVGVLSDFASNITRYYNLDLVTGDPRAAVHDDPVKAWHELVIKPVLNLHYSPRQKLKHQQNAELIARLLGDHAMARHHSETGEVLDNLYDASLQTGVIDSAKPYVRMYVMQLARFLARLLSELTYAAYEKRMESIPHFSDFFAIFNNDDEYFRRRKTWSTYRN